MAQTDLPSPPPYAESKGRPHESVSPGDDATPYDAYASSTSTAQHPLSAAPYFNMRPPPARQPGMTIVHNFNITHGTTASSVKFPKPEHSWMSRDVDMQDWQTFLRYLMPRQNSGSNMQGGDYKIQSNTKVTSGPVEKVETEAAFRRRIEYQVAEWNDEFFKPRGLEVHADINAAAAATAPVRDQPRRGFGFTCGRGGIGLEVGSSLVGVALPPNSSGYGLRLGNVLLGVTEPAPKTSSASGVAESSSKPAE
jgi:hypothetical protein